MEKRSTDPPRRIKVGSVVRCCGLFLYEYCDAQESATAWLDLTEKMLQEIAIDGGAWQDSVGLYRVDSPKF